MNKKRQISFFLFHDRTGIVAHLEKMAQNGWLIEKIGYLFWHYRKIEPQNLHFAVSYFPDATDFDPYPSEKQETFRDFCRHAGWTLATSSAQLEIYYSDLENPVPIETDSMIELEVIHKASKKSVISTYSSLLAVSLVQLWNITRDFTDDPLNFLLNNASLFTFFFILMLALLCVKFLSSYLLWYYKAKKQVKLGGSLPDTKSSRKFQTIYLFIGIVGLLSFILQAAFSSKKYFMITLLVIGLFTLCFLGALMTKHILKKKGASAETNQKLTFIVLFFSMSVMTMVFVLLITNRLGDSVFEENETILHRRESIFLIQWEEQDIISDSEIDYSITQIKIPAMYNYVFNRIYFNYERPFYKEYYSGLIYEYVEIDADVFDAEKAYELTVNYLDGRSKVTYLICYEDRIVEVDTHGMDLEPNLIRNLGRE